MNIKKTIISVAIFTIPFTTPNIAVAAGLYWLKVGIIV